MVSTLTIIYVIVPIIIQAVLVAVTFALLLSIRKQSVSMNEQSSIISKEFDSSHKAIIGPATVFHKITSMWEFHIFNYGKLTAHEVNFNSIMRDVPFDRKYVEDIKQSTHNFMLFPSQDMSTKMPLPDTSNLDSVNTAGEPFFLYYGYRCSYYLDEQSGAVGHVCGIIRFLVAISDNIYNYQNNFEIIDQWN